MSQFDVIVIGSGFGGAVTACRLAEKGLRVLVLERGRRWKRKEYPSVSGEDLVWDALNPGKRNGWFEFRAYEHMTVVQGAGVGGGSLVYANVHVEPKAELFNQGWPPEITLSELRPYYDRVGKMLNIQKVPDNQVTRRFRLMQEGAAKLGYADRFRSLELAVTFDPEYSYDQPDPFNHSHARTFTNAEGVEQGTCVHCGNCDIGCPTGARNTLDVNYIPRAEKHGAEVRELHIVECITPQDGGYRVDFKRIDRTTGRLTAGYETARRVIVSAGSMGSTELLLRCRDQHKTLPHLSPFLGCNWSSNGDFLTPAFHDPEHRISPTQGPTISSAIDFLDGSVDGQQFFIEDGGFPPVVNNWLQRELNQRPRDPLLKAVFLWLRQQLGERVRSSDPLSNAMPWFSQGIDAADGRLVLRRPWFAPWRRRLHLDWDINRSEAVINAIVRMHERLARATGGVPVPPPTWTLLKMLITPHPLGGCNMGTTRENGVVDHRGQAFGYENLFVADGAIVPEAVGLNPSKTIAALSERIADLMPA